MAKWRARLMVSASRSSSTIGRVPASEKSSSSTFFNANAFGPAIIAPQSERNSGKYKSILSNISFISSLAAGDGVHLRVEHVAGGKK